MQGFLLTAPFTLFGVHGNRMRAIAFSRSPGFHHWNAFWKRHLIFVGRRTENKMFLPGNCLLNRISSVQLMFKEIKINEWLQTCNQHFTTYICASAFVYTRCKDTTMNFWSLNGFSAGKWEFSFSLSVWWGIMFFFVYSATVTMFQVWLGLQA